MSMEKTLPAELEATVRRAQARAEESGELRPVPTSRHLRSVPGEVVTFVRQVLSDGTYADAIESLGAKDPEIESI